MVDGVSENAKLYVAERNNRALSQYLAASGLFIEKRQSGAVLVCLLKTNEPMATTDDQCDDRLLPLPPSQRTSLLPGRYYSFFVPLRIGGRVVTHHEDTNGHSS